MYKKICVKCWFLDSEEFIAKLAVKEGWSRRISIRKVIDPLNYVTGRLQGLIEAEQYEFYGKEEKINEVEEFFNTSDYDVEII